MTSQKRHNFFSLLVLMVGGLLLGFISCGKALAPAGVTINSRTWAVELAATPQQRYLGLAGRKSLPPGTGMLFLFERPEVLEFCMRGCLIDLDIAFISPDMRVVRTCTMTAESDLPGRAVYSSRAPAQYALEVPASELAEAGVRPGQKVRFSGKILLLLKLPFARDDDEEGRIPAPSGPRALLRLE